MWDVTGFVQRFFSVRCFAGEKGDAHKLLDRPCTIEPPFIIQSRDILDILIFWHQRWCFMPTCEYVLRFTHVSVGRGGTLFRSEVIHTRFYNLNHVATYDEPWVVQAKALWSTRSCLPALFVRRCGRARISCQVLWTLSMYLTPWQTFGLPWDLQCIGSLVAKYAQLMYGCTFRLSSDTRST